MELEQIETYYRANYSRILKRLVFRAGTQWAAEDIIQTAFERAIRYRYSCDPPRFGQWFSLIVNNALRDYYTEENGYTGMFEDYEEAGSEGCPHFQEQIMREIFELIDTKSVDQIEVLMLHFKYGYSAIDISRVTAHPYAKSHKIISRFRFELRDLYNE